MYFVIFLIIFLVLLIAISIVNLFLAFALKLVTNNSIEESKFILPSILYLITSGISFILMYLVTINILGLNLSESIMAIIFGTVDITSKLHTIILVNSIIVIVSILIESICLLTVNIDYTIAFGKIRMFFKDMIKKLKGVINNKRKKNDENTNNTEVKNQEMDKENETTTSPKYITVLKENEISENKERLKLSILNAVICSFFIFSFLSFIFMALFTAGNMLSSKLL